MTQEHSRAEREAQLNYLEQRGIDPYPGVPFKRDFKNNVFGQNFENLRGKVLTAAGRITSVREHGGRVFFDLQDEDGKVQVTLTRESVGDEGFEIFEKGFAVGDWAGVKGELFRTRSGEVTIAGQEITMLAKTLLAPPKKLEDIETRSRQRYLDMMVNNEVRERFKLRSKLVEFMRQRFISLDCTEVETPILDTTYGGANARPFVTRHNALGIDAFLRISNELYLKRFLVGGFGAVFEFSRDFRNEGMDATHNPEFTQVELYKAHTDYKWMMNMSESLMFDAAQNLLGKTSFVYNGKTIDLKTPWRRLSIYDGLKQELKIDAEKISDKDLLKLGKKNGISESDRGHILVELFDKFVTPTLINPTFVIDYPESTSPLTKKHRTVHGLVERFECVVAGMETMNCYTELNDPRKQRANFQDQLKRRAMGDQEAMLEDEDFIIAMEHGMPPMGGIGISIDRWTMLLTNAKHIREVIVFPLLKPDKK